MAQSLISSQTDEDFNKAHNKALFNEIQHLLNPEEATLISFTDIKKMLRPKNELYKGMQIVPINLIVGSEGRYKDFDNHFFPKSNFLKARWERVDSAVLQNITLPPISLYEAGGLFFVRDGNHRVSVAKMKGQEYIDAEVVSLQSEIKLKPSTSKKNILKQVLNYEKRVFYSETNFGDLTDYWCLDFTTPGQYDVIYNHIITHRYYINMDKTEEIPFEDALLSWFNNVYTPVVKALESNHIKRIFKRRTLSDMYIYLIKYWDELKQKFGNDFTLEAAVKDFKKEYSQKHIVNRIKNLFAKRKMNN
ncbi:MAG: transcriptional regulator [Treponema sp.]|nr:transcriptional regulator [Treponema sp.]MBQ4236176.1 transcriptional regulator [Treponema sp.]MBQ5385080.1 transcriptional regulator [Treponema sp.]